MKGNEMRAKLNLGKVDGYGNGRKTCAVEVELELTDDGRFTASGTVWNSRHTDCIMGGQCLDDLMEYDEMKMNLKFRVVYRWWKKWHLNDMHAGTVKQEEALEQAGLHNWASDYDKCCKYLESVGLLIDNGYKFGTGWLKRDIPYDTQESMRKFIKENQNENLL